MPTTLRLNAQEKSTYVIEVSFLDEKDRPVLPSAATWTLSDLSGNIINGRQQVVIVPAETVSIVLSGDDLVVNDTYGRQRVLTVEFTYFSELSSNMQGKDWVYFTIDDNVVIT